MFILIFDLFATVTDRVIRHRDHIACNSLKCVDHVFQFHTDDHIECNVTEQLSRMSDKTPFHWIDQMNPTHHLINKLTCNSLSQLHVHSTTVNDHASLLIACLNDSNNSVMPLHIACEDGLIRDFINWNELLRQSRDLSKQLPLLYLSNSLNYSGITELQSDIKLIFTSM